MILKLNETNCHNFKNAESIGRCPCVSVCTENCVYVWKECYSQLMNTTSTRNRLEDALERINDLESELEDAQREIDSLQDAEEYEDKYNYMKEELAGLLSEESADKLYQKYSEGSVGAWAYDVYDLWEVYNACRTK